MAKGKRGGGNRGSRGGGTSGRAFRVIGRKKRLVGRPRKARGPLTAAFTGPRQAPEPPSEPVDIEEKYSRADPSVQKDET